MILAIGEILADMVGETKDGVLTFKSFCGGAPFNVAVNAKNADAKVGFIGRVGKDVIGRFVTEEAKRVYRIYKGVMPYKELFNDGFDDGTDNMFPEG